MIRLQNKMLYLSKPIKIRTAEQLVLLYQGNQSAGQPQGVNEGPITIHCQSVQGLDQIYLRENYMPYTSLREALHQGKKHWSAKQSKPITEVMGKLRITVSSGSKWSDIKYVSHLLAQLAIYSRDNI